MMRKDELGCDVFLTSFNIFLRLYYDYFKSLSHLFPLIFLLLFHTFFTSFSRLLNVFFTSFSRLFTRNLCLQAPLRCLLPSVTIMPAVLAITATPSSAASD